jgi:hypothetical protein
MMKAKINDCVGCGKVSIVSVHFKVYVCDDCRQKKKEQNKRE